MLRIFPVRCLRVLSGSQLPLRSVVRSSVPRITLITPHHNFCTTPLRYEKLTDKTQTKQVPDVAKIIPQPEKSKLSNDIYTIPNILTMSRIFATPFIGYFIASGQSTPAITLFVYSSVSDFVDGYIARKYNLKSVLGSILDPAADKFLMTVCTVALSVQSIMPWYVATIIVGRDVMLSFMAFYVRFKSLPPPRTLNRFLDMSIVTHTVHPNLLGKANTALQMVYIGGLVLLPGIELVVGTGDALRVFFDWLGIAVALTTFSSGLTYVFSRNAVKLLK